MENVLDVAKYIIIKCKQEQEHVSKLNLQKIIYIIQKTFLQIGSQAFKDDFEAWQIGPVIRDVYNRYCGFGASRIRLSYSDIQVSDGFRKIADFIIISKRKLEPWQIFEEVQEAGGAWDTVYCNGRGDHFVISKNLIREKCSVV